MARIRVTKQFHFEMAHALLNYDGLCRNVHGHSYKLMVTIIGEPEQAPGNSNDGMVFDFGRLKKLVGEHVIDKLDHSIMVNQNAADCKCGGLEQMYERMHLVPFQPTSENLTIFIAERIKSFLPPHVELFSVKLHETENSFAEWFADDNRDEN